MSVTRAQRLLATVVVSSALAIGGLTVAPSAADAAGPGTTATYTCTNKLPIPAPLSALVAPSFKVPATWSVGMVEGLPAVLGANVPFPAGLPVVGTLNFNNLGTGGLGLLPGLVLTLEGTINTVLTTAGLAAVAVPLTGVFSPLNAGIVTFNGTLGGFVPTEPGDLPIAVPTSFDFGMAAGILGVLGYHCTLDNAQTQPPIATLHVGKAGSSVQAKVLTKQVKKGSLGKVKVTVRSAGSATGTVIAKLKGKTIGKATLKRGRATLKLRKLTKLGVNKVQLIYSGSSSTSGSKKTVKVTVVG